MKYIWMYWILQIKINLVCLEWDYSIPFVTYEKLMQSNVEFIKNNLFSFFHKVEQHCVE